MHQMTLKVEGMSCAHCERRVGEALAALPGVSVLKVSATEARVLLELEDTAAGEEELKAAVESAGYRVP